MARRLGCCRPPRAWPCRKVPAARAKFVAARQLPPAKVVRAGLGAKSGLSGKSGHRIQRTMKLRDLRFAIDDLRTSMAGDGHRSFEQVGASDVPAGWGCSMSVKTNRGFGGTGRIHCWREGCGLGQSALRGQVNPCKVLGIKGRWAWLSLVGPFFIKNMGLKQPEEQRIPAVSGDFQSIPITFGRNMGQVNIRYANDDLRKVAGARIKGVAIPQSVRCTVKRRRGATLSTPRRAEGCLLPRQFRYIPTVSNDFQSIPITF